MSESTEVPAAKDLTPEPVAARSRTIVMGIVGTLLGVVGIVALGVGVVSALAAAFNQDYQEVDLLRALLLLLSAVVIAAVCFVLAWVIDSDD